MIFFKFSKPKQTISNILFIFGLFSLLITFIAGVTVILWKYYPTTVDKIDKIIPDYYGDKIKELYKKAKESEKEEEKFKSFSKLYTELEDISTLNKYYQYRQESARWLIQYYQNQKKNNEALKIAKKWEKNYPYDFSAKFVYIDVLSTVDNNASLVYIERLYNKHQDIKEVKERYIAYLLKHHYYNKALEISLKKDILAQNKAKFQIFYIDNAKSFSEKQAIKYSKNDYQFSQGVYNLKFNKKFHKFKGLRIDIDSILQGTIISDIQLIINENKVTIGSVHHIKNIDKKEYKTIGNDPYLIFSIPKQLQNYSGEVNISFRCKIKESDIVSTKVLQNNEWQFFVDNGKKFNEQDSIHFILSKDNNKFIANSVVDFKNVSRIRLDFPFLINLKIYSFIIILNDKYIYTKKDILHLNSVENKKDYLMVKNLDPSITIKLHKQVDIKNINIQIKFLKWKNNEQ